MKKIKDISYKIEIMCKVNKYGAVIPCGSCVEIQDDSGNNLNQLDYPTAHDIMVIWNGIYKQYPKIGRKI